VALDVIPLGSVTADCGEKEGCGANTKFLTICFREVNI